MTIAVDGPSGSGKSSVSRAVARELGLGYLDTGAMYRALAWWCLEQHVDVEDTDAVARAATDLPLVLSTDPDAPRVQVGQTDVTGAIREDRVTRQVSAVATNLDVRAELRRRQRRIIEEERGRTGGVVAEGRDITTVVAPDADLRVLLTASEEARLARRATERHGAADAAALAATRDLVLRRDRQDSTVSAFLEAADGVVALDTSSLTFDEVVATLLGLARGEVRPDVRAGTPHTP